MGRWARTTLSNLEFQILDHNSAYVGVSLRTLMQNAAKALAREARRFRPKRVLVVCGSGNNGGDGLAMAALLADELEVRVVLAAPPAKIQQPEARWAYEALDRSRVAVEVFRDPARFQELARDSDLIVDAMLGSGTRGELREPIRSLVRLINASRRPVLAVDVPTGYEGRLAVRATVTVCLHAKKQGLPSANAGRILVRDIGIPDEAATSVGPADFFVAYPRNDSGSHKGQNGRVLVVAGGPYTGAPLLCASAALRTGVDLVRLLTPSEAAHAAQVGFPDLIVHQGAEARRLVPEDVETAKRLLPRIDAVLIGPGLGDAAETQQAVAQLLGATAHARKRVVLDADAVAVAGQDPALVRRLRPLVTPHRGEFKEYTGRAVPRDPKSALTVVRDQARRLRSTLLVKGPVDLVSDGRRTKTNTHHHPAMTTGGTGDVLAGLVTGFVAKGMEPFHAACAAAFANGDAGLRVARRQGGTLTATDLVRELPRVFRAWLGKPSGTRTLSSFGKESI